jgi:hypothetical protein
LFACSLIKLTHDKVGLTDTTIRAQAVIRHVVPFCTGSNTFFWQTAGFIKNIAADCAFPLFILLDSSV